MTQRLYNTLTRQLEPFIPLESGCVRMYVCGMTVYDLCHIGHARMMLAFDVVQRWFKASGYRVTYVRNITDIEDKIIKRAVERGVTLRALTDEMVTAMHADIAALGIEPPTHEPRATDYVPQMLRLIERLMHKGLAYRAASGDVNFAVRQFEGYGRLSGRSLDQLRAGERVAVDADKRDPLDFVLWKQAKDTEPREATFSSPFGPGRPGWHIECSAMSCALLGDNFDLHGGGMDLQFPHHENELAQSEGASGVRFANYWMHNGFVTVDGEKMSKSLGNFFTIREVLAQFDGESLRFAMLRVHYRSPLHHSDAMLEDARQGLRRLYTTLQAVAPQAWDHDWSHPAAARFKAAMDEDFNTPQAVAVLFDLAADINRQPCALLSGVLKGLGGVLGLLQQPPEQFLQAGTTLLDVADVEAQIARRQEAKRRKDFGEADRIRNALAAQGIALKDSPDGTSWVRA